MHVCMGFVPSITTSFCVSVVDVVDVSDVSVVSMSLLSMSSMSLNDVVV